MTFPQVKKYFGLENGRGVFKLTLKEFKLQNVQDGLKLTMKEFKFLDKCIF